MARQAITPNAVLTIPGAYASYTVQSNPSGLATSGILLLVGEAAQGPAFSEESSIAATFFGPDQIAAIQAKYGSGNLVDAARIAASAANDPNITGSPQGFYLFKTNVSAKASRAAARVGFADYGTLYDKSYGLPGNTIGTVITESPSEVAPSATFTYIPIPVATPGSGNSKLALRVDGLAEASVTFADKITPTTAVGATVHSSDTGLNALANVLATGGVHRTVLQATQTLGVTFVGPQVTITAAVLPWATTPSAGDTMIIPANATYGAGQDSALAGAGSANLGLYIVNSASATTIVATKLRDAAALTVTTPVTVTAGTAINADLTDIEVYSPVTLQSVTGKDRPVLVTGNVGVNVSGVASGQSLTVTLASGSWGAQPQANDLMKIPSTAPAGFFGAGNGGWYRVTSSTAASVTATRLSNGAPNNFSATAVAATTDLVFRRPAVDGEGKTLELYDGASDLTIADSLYTAAGVPVTFLSTSAAPQTVTSATELSVDINNSKGSFSEDLTAGGDIGLQVGCTSTSCTMTITAKTLTTTPSGGSAAALSISLKQYATIGSLAAFINSQPGYTASSGNNLIAQKPLMNGTTTVLDQGIYACSSKFGAQTARVKFDAYDFWATLNSGSVLLQLGNPSAAATAGLPEAEALAFLSGGSVGGTTNATVTAAFAKAEGARLNFVVPLFSTDATADAANDLTDASSTYTIAAVNAAAKSHVLKMSVVKARRNRQAWLSYSGTFAGAQAAAASAATFRATMCFENFLAQNSAGDLVTFQPWAGACYAAAMQAAGFYKSIMKKFINTSGVSPVDSTFDPENDTDVETALLAGLLPARSDPSGGFIWVSDQTTYAVDSNFVFNSCQTVYAADLVSLTTAQRMERALVGQSLADVSAASAAGIFSAIMVDLKRLKLLASSDDAPAGFKNAVFNVQGDIMYVSAEIKVSTTLAFVPINFTVTQITQTATA